MKKRITCCILALVILLVCLPACSQNGKHSDAFYGMGTYVTITLYGSESAAKSGFAEARAKVAELDALWSLNEAGSDLSRLNASLGGISDADPRTAELIGASIALSSATDGCFDVTLAALSSLWQTCGKENRLPTDAELETLLSAVGTETLRVDGTTIEKPNGVQVDLGAIAKGAATALLAECLQEIDGLTAGLVSLGSCVSCFGTKSDGSAFRVSIRDPKDRSATIGTLTLREGEVLSVSGDYERFVTIGGETYHHILDPATGYPSDSGLSSVAVVAADGPTADALSTAFMVMGEARALAYYHSGELDFEAVFVRSDGTVVCTDHVQFQE